MIRFNLEVNECEVETRIEIPAYVIEYLAEELKAIDKRFGPDRDYGPVTFVLDGSEETAIIIGTQKQGDQEYVMDRYGVIRTWTAHQEAH